MPDTVESTYPIRFRAHDAQNLGEFIRKRQSVVVIGMKRVGISNFLRFFLHHNAIDKTYIKNDGNNLFIRIDLNDLVERDIYPFWTLILKRLVDTVEKSSLPAETKNHAKRVFSESIQLKDLFVTVESCRKIVSEIANAGFLPTLFLVRFDRITDTINHTCLNNLQSLIDSSQHKLSYVFTSFRPLHKLASDVLSKKKIAGFIHEMYLKPASITDMEEIYKTYQKKHNLRFSATLKTDLLKLAGGHVQYLHLGINTIQSTSHTPTAYDELFTRLTTDEEITLLSEELFENLSQNERDTLLKVHHKDVINSTQREKAKYLWNTGIVQTTHIESSIFSPLFAFHVSKVGGNGAKDEFTKKEHALFSFLKKNEGNLCERESIIHAVWPEQEELGVSDWAIDRLVSRVRSKLKKQNSPYEITTVVTRGYKLISKE